MLGFGVESFRSAKNLTIPLVTHECQATDKWDCNFARGTWNVIIPDEKHCLSDLKKNLAANFSLSSSWRPPSNRWIKVNSDGSDVLEAGISATGGVLRDAHSKWILGFMRKTGSAIVFQVEARALLEGIRIAWEKGFRRISFRNINRQQDAVADGMTKLGRISYSDFIICYNPPSEVVPYIEQQKTRIANSMMHEPG
ncbi:hypothetical protein GOBAR_AA36833 [Gossypium barbadense]|uniref:RNase H type-1 domain-containing protein n=1 Tax=Gossypium barbadense TaxID=3634 RepID=A0A2P5VYK2_GOSBA|nr:hypothetical protein GOBAR_AA36833 [Gossypium barbadense]